MPRDLFNQIDRFHSGHERTDLRFVFRNESLIRYTCELIFRDLIVNDLVKRRFVLIRLLFFYDGVIEKKTFYSMILNYLLAKEFFFLRSFLIDLS